MLYSPQLGHDHAWRHNINISGVFNVIYRSEIPVWRRATCALNMYLYTHDVPLAACKNVISRKLITGPAYPCDSRPLTSVRARSGLMHRLTDINYQSTVCSVYVYTHIIPHTHTFAICNTTSCGRAVMGVWVSRSWVKCNCTDESSARGRF